jgi:flagellar hook protein FlgE
VGLGVGVESVRRVFSQGGLTNTGNNLDVGISGDGFFVVRDTRVREDVYTRAGQFSVDDEGFLVTSGGQRVLGFEADADGKITADAGQALAELRIDVENLPSQKTTQVDVRFNLDADSELIPASTPFDHTNPNTYNNTNTLTVFDAVGGSHTLTLYFKRIETGQVLTSAGNGGSRWEVYTRLDDGIEGYLDSETATSEPKLMLEFDGTGTMTGWAVNSESGGAYAALTGNADGADTDTLPDPITSGGTPTRGTVYQLKQENSQSLPEIDLKFTLPTFASDPPSGSASAASNPFSFKLTLGDKDFLTTQFVDNFAPQFLQQNGNSSGALSGFSLDDEGKLVVRYDNGITAVKGQLALANFRAPDELRSVSGNLFIPTPGSGAARRLPPGFVTENGRLGTVKPGTLEESNVDLTQELVRLIISQRLYQANAKTIQVQSEAAQAILTVV